MFSSVNENKQIFTLKYLRFSVERNALNKKLLLLVYMLKRN